MMIKLNSYHPRIFPILLILLAVLIVMGAAGSGLILPTDLAPLVAGIAPLLVVVVILLFQRPAWAMYLTLIMVFIPMGLIPSGWQSLLNRILTVLALVVWLFDVLRHGQKILWNRAHWFFLGFLIWSLASLIWTENINISSTIIQGFTLRFILFFLILLNQIRTKTDLDRFMDVLALIGWVVVVTSAAAIISTGYLPGSRLEVGSENSNSLGIVALMALPGILWRTVRPEKSRKFLFHLLAFVYITLTIIVTAASGSRGSAISIVISLCAMLLFRRTRTWALICIGVLLLTGLVAPSLFTTTINRFSGTYGDPILGGREYAWPAGFDLIRDHPFFGVGIGNSSYSVIPYMMLYANVSQYSKAPLHNPVLAILADVGIPGIVFYLGFFISAVTSMARLNRAHYRRKIRPLIPYYSLVWVVFLGYMASWIKGGGMELDHSYFFILALLLIPANLNLKTFEVESSSTEG